MSNRGRRWISPNCNHVFNHYKDAEGFVSLYKVSGNMDVEFATTTITVKELRAIFSGSGKIPTRMVADALGFESESLLPIKKSMMKKALKFLKGSTEVTVSIRLTEDPELPRPQRVSEGKQTYRDFFKDHTRKRFKDHITIKVTCDDRNFYLTGYPDCPI